jgi:hypothetical protein
MSRLRTFMETIRAHTDAYNRDASQCTLVTRDHLKDCYLDLCRVASSLGLPRPPRFVDADYEIWFYEAFGRLQAEEDAQERAELTELQEQSERPPPTTPQDSESESEFSVRPEGTGADSDREGAEQSERADKRKRRRGKPPLEQTHPLRFQVYQRIEREHQPGDDYKDTVDRLKGDKDFTDQVKDAEFRLNTKLVRKALALFDQRQREARKKKETDSA